MRNLRVDGADGAPAGCLQNGRWGVDSPQGRKKAASGGGEGVESYGPIYPLWTTYSETAGFGARRRCGHGEGGVRAMDNLVHGGGRRERNDRRTVGHFMAHVYWEGLVLDAGAHHDPDDWGFGGNRVRVHDFDGDVWG